jgi:hypothetical protein
VVSDIGPEGRGALLSRLRTLAGIADDTREVIESLRKGAEQCSDALGRFDATAGYCEAIDLLLGQVWAAFENAARDVLKNAPEMQPSPLLQGLPMVPAEGEHRTETLNQLVR